MMDSIGFALESFDGVGRYRTFDEVGDPAWSDFYRSSYTINTIPQEMSENGADPAHFRYVHGTDEVAEVEVAFEPGLPGGAERAAHRAPGL